MHDRSIGAAATRLLFFSGGMKKQAERGHRIVSLAPSATAILCAVGARRTLVGVTKWCADVAPVGDLPKLGDCWHLESVNEIVGLRPTLVIGSVPYKQETVARLLEQPLNFLAMNPRSLGDVYADIRLLGGIVGRANAAAALARKLQRGFAAIERKSKGGAPGLRVYCEAWPKPRISSPPWVAELVNICGGAMIVPAGERVNEKQVAAAQPDVIVLAWAATGDHANAKKAYEVREWREVPAVRNRRVTVISDELLNTPGPPLLKGAIALWNALHPRGQERDNAKRQRTSRSAET